MTRSTKPGISKSAHLLLSLLLLAVVLPIGAQDGLDAADDQVPTAWDDYVSRNPGAVDDDTIGPLERRVLHALTPAQAEAFFGGTDPSQIVLASGETLAQFLLDSVGGGPGLVYVPVDQCRLFATAFQTAPVTGAMAANEVRGYFARGSGTSHTDQGGVADCLIADEAVAVVMHFRVVATGVAGNGYLKAWRADLPEPSSSVLDYETTIRRFDTAAVVELCALGACATGEFKVKTAALGGQVRGDVAGYFRPIEVADVPGAGDADTLDGLDSTDFALVTHTHGGGDIVSGTVGEPFIDPLIARDDEVVDILKANDGSGSGVDADLLDGLEVTAFRPRPQNVILVDASGGGDFTTISTALASVSGESASNRFLVRVGPGTFNEQVTMKPFVDIEGKGKKATILSSASVAGPEGTLECADDAEVRNLTVESTGGGEKAIAIRCFGTSPMLTHVKAVATGAAGGATPENIGVLNDGAGAMPMLTGVHVDANPTPGLGVVNQNGAMPTIRDSDLAGADSAIENRDTATAKIASTALTGGADVMAPAIQASYMCVQAYVSGTLQKLNDECNPNTPPTATDDAYASLGNTLLEVTLDYAGAASAVNTTASQPSVIGETTTPKTYRSVFENDTDAETADKNLLTAAVVGGTVSAGAVVNMFADGTFEYTPPVGLTGPDTFDYTVTDPGGLADTGTVTVNVSNLIWFVDNSNAGTADGRSTTPYTSLAPIDAGGGDDGLDGAGDTIFVFTGAGSTGDGILLEASQVLQGNEIALAPAGFEYAGGANLVAAGTAPTLGNAAGDVIELASGNTVRGLDIGATAGLAITGTGVAGATIDEVGTSGTGSGNGVLFDGVTGTIAMTDLDVNSSTNWGVAIQNSSATFTFDAASSITNPTGGAISVVSGAPNVTYSGTITNNNAQTINVSSTTGGTVLFNGASINGDSSAGILLTSVGGNVTVDAGSTTINNGSGSGISIQSASTGTFRFDDVTIMSPTTAGIDINGGAGDALTGTVDFNNVDVTSGSASGPVSIAGLGAGAGGVDFDAASAVTSTNGGITITSNGGGTVGFNGPVVLSTATLPAVNATSNTGATINFAGNLDIDTTTGTGFNVTSGGTVNVDSSASSTTIDTGTGIGVNIGAGIGTTGVSFDTVNVNGSTAGIILANTGTGTFNVTAGTIQNITAGSTAAADFNNVDGTVNIGASISNSGGRSMRITTGSAGAFTFTGVIDDNAEGIDISANAAGATFTFSGGIDIDTNGSSAGFNAFDGGTLNICGDSNCDGTGTARMNTVNTSAGTGRAVIIDGVDIGTLGAGPPTLYGVTFESLTVDGAPEGIKLNDASTGGFLVTGDAGTTQNGSGGTLRNITGDGISLTDVSNVELNQVAFGAAATTGTLGHCVLGLRLVNLEINDSTFNNHGDADEENCFTFTAADGSGQAGITGTFTLDNVDVEDFFENGVEIFNESGNLVMNVINGSDFEDNDDTFGNRAIFVETEGTAGITLVVDGSTFTDIEENIVRFEAGGSGTNDVDIIGNISVDAGGPDDFPNGGNIQLIPTDDATLTFDIKGNNLRDARGAFIDLSGTSGGGNLEGRIGGPNVSDGNVLSGTCLGDGILITMDGFATDDTHNWTILVQNNSIGVDPLGTFQGIGDDGIQILHRDNGGTLNLTIEDNVIRTGSVSAGICGGGDTAGMGSEAIRIFSDEDLGHPGNPTNNVRIADNEIPGTGPGNEIELRTSDDAVSCYHAIDNDNGSGGSPGTINFSIGGTSTGEITQASVAALQAANNSATVTGATPSFNGSCTNPSTPTN